MRLLIGTVAKKVRYEPWQNVGVFFMGAMGEGGRYLNREFPCVRYYSD
jgi:hypothetical protein